MAKRTGSKTEPYKSKFEKEVSEALEEADISFTYEAECFQWWEKLYRSICEDCGSNVVVKERWYTPDFFIENGPVLECKGRFTAHDRKIALGMRKYHPEIDLRYVFISNNKLKKNSKIRYMQWCKRNKIKAYLKDNIKELINEIQDETGSG